MVVARRASRARIGGYVLAVGGALLLLAVLSPMFGWPLDQYWLTIGFFVAMAVGFGMLAVAGDGPSKVALAAAAIGWAVRAIAFFVPAIGFLGGIANLLIVFGGLIGAVLLMSGSRGGRAGAVLLVVAMLLLVGFIYPQLIPFLPPAASAVIPGLLGAALLAAGVMLPRK
ncbi:MAG TPA: hypothetical protein VIL55_15975 [Naasia sp.]|jgi:hypothetical protein